VPLSFLFGLIACFAVVSASLVSVHWYSTTLAGAVCLFQYLWALKIACDDKERRFPFAAFVFSGTYYLAMFGNCFGGTPIATAIWMLQGVLHPLPEDNGKPVLFNESMGWFDDVASIGVALIISTVSFFVLSIRRRKTLKEGSNSEMS
jgi:hypothetical protein